MRKTLMLTAGVLTIMGAVTAGAMARGDFEHHGKHHGFHGKHGYHHDGDWGRGGHGKGHHRLHRKLAKLKKLDADGDGVVTLEEFLKPSEERFAELDTDGKGSLTGEQLVARQQAQLDYRIKRMLKRYDTDGDGKISKEEFRKPAQDRFAERDFNGDGKITDDELPPDLDGAIGTVLMMLRTPTIARLRLPTMVTAKKGASIRANVTTKDVGIVGITMAVKGGADARREI